MLLPLADQMGRLVLFLLEAMLRLNFNYYELESDVQDFVSAISANLDFRKLGLDTRTKIEKYIEDMVSQIADNENADALQEAITSLMKVDIDNPYAEYVKEVEDALAAITKLAPEISKLLTKEMQVKLGIDIDMPGLRKALADSQSELQIQDKSLEDRLTILRRMNEIMNEFTKQEIDLMIMADDSDIDLLSGSIKELREQYEAWREAVRNAARDKAFAESLEKTSKNVKLLTDAMAEQWATGEISRKTYEKLYDKGEDYQKLIGETADGYKLLSSETAKFANELVNQAIRQGVANGYTEEQISLFRALFNTIHDLNEEMNSYISRIEKSANSMLDQKSMEIEDARKTLQLQMRQMESYIAIEKKRLDITNQVAAAEREITAVLEANKASYQYLSEDTRALIFNEKDFDILSKKLGEINREADVLYNDYLSKISSLTEETAYQAEYITRQYERQTELLFKQHQISVDELNLEKERLNLRNTMAYKYRSSNVNPIAQGCAA